MLVPPDGVDADEVKRSNDAITAGARGRLAALTQILVATFAGSHVNGFLRMCHAAAECANRPNVAPNGSIDKAALSQAHPDLSKALYTGLRFGVVHYGVFRKFPLLLDASQKAHNTAGVMGRSEVEGILDMNQTRALSKGPCNWQRVTESAVSTDPVWKPWASAMADAVKRMPKDQVCQVSTLR